MVFPVIGGDGKPTGYEIDNSLMFYNGDYLKDTSFGTGTNRKKFTFSFWIKMTNLDTGGNPQVVYSNDENDQIGFTGDQKFRFVDSGSVILQTNRFFRDVSAWYHIVLAVDTTQGTGSNRYKLYVNGTQETSLETNAGISQNTDLNFHNNETHAIGRSQYDGNRFLYAYLAEFHAIDGQQLDASYFGETNDNGVWIPKEYTGTYGNNGMFMEFKQSGTGQSSSSMGADTSGNDNHFVTIALAATNQTTDTPTNNFATVNSAIRPYSGESLSEGNLKATATHASVSGSFWGTIPLTNGKWYWECKITTLRNAHWIGVSDDLAKAGLGTTTAAARSYGIFYKNNGKKSIDETESNYGNTYAQGDIIGVALDMDNKNIYFSKNGTFQNSGDPTTGASGTGKANSSDLEAIVLPACMQDNGNATVTEWNFGNPTFSISSGNTDGLYGNFEYAPPSGYYALCTKRLAEFG